MTNRRIRKDIMAIVHERMEPVWQAAFADCGARFSQAAREALLMEIAAARGLAFLRTRPNYPAHIYGGDAISILDDAPEDPRKQNGTARNLFCIVNDVLGDDRHNPGLFNDAMQTLIADAKKYGFKVSITRPAPNHPYRSIAIYAPRA